MCLPGPGEGWSAAGKNPKCGRFGVNMGESNKYYVTVEVDRCIIPGGLMICATNKDIAAQKAEMKIALQMRDAISVRAINVREG
jgi:hypothetical protein